MFGQDMLKYHFEDGQLLLLEGQHPAVRPQDLWQVPVGHELEDQPGRGRGPDHGNCSRVLIVKAAGRPVGVCRGGGADVVGVATGMVVLVIVGVHGVTHAGCWER